MRVAIYARVSRVGQTVENQLIKLKDYANRQGWTYDIYTEQESSGKERPVQYNVHSDLLQGKYDGLLINSIAGWASSCFEFVNHIDDFNRFGVKFVSLLEPFDSTTAHGKFTLYVFASVAEFYGQLIGERTHQESTELFKKRIRNGNS